MRALIQLIDRKRLYESSLLLLLLTGFLSLLFSLGKFIGKTALFGHLINIDGNFARLPAVERVPESPLLVPLYAFLEVWSTFEEQYQDQADSNYHDPGHS